MIYATIPHLLDMCATSIVYRLWTRQDIYENWSEDDHWQLLESKVTSDVENLPLPKLVESRLLSIVKPAGRHFFGFFDVWLSKMVTSEKWLTRGMLSDCLTLYAVGSINQRKTAEKLLRSKTLDNVIAFRLACINFLEVEVLRLWPRVFQYFLNKIVLEHQKVEFHAFKDVSEMILYLTHGYKIARYGSIQEPCEVLFWIGYCLSKERGTYLSAVPHYAQNTIGIDWYRHALYWAGISGDISFFEYVINSSSTHMFCNHEDEIEKNCLKSNNYLISFFYHFSSLKTDRKVELFRKSPREIVSYFLQWPLSSLFLDPLNDHQEICDMFFQLDLLDWLFVTILEILHGVIYMGYKWSNLNGYKPPEVKISDVYSADHLEQIWTALWEVCPDETKSRIMNSFVFTDNLNNFLEKASHQMNFDTSVFREDLRRLFRLHGEAFLMFLEVKHLADALEKIISKYMPERNFDFRLLQLPQFSNKPSYKIVTAHYFNTIGQPGLTIGPYVRIVAGLHFPVSSRRIDKKIVRPKMRFELREIRNAVGQEFINYIQEFLLWNNMNPFELMKIECNV